MLRNRDLFDEDVDSELNINAQTKIVIADEAVILKRFAVQQTREILSAIATIETITPFRSMQTPNGYSMSVAMTNCGEVGWTSDSQGYRYTIVDPLTSHRWPEMPNLFLSLAQSAANEAGFPDFKPDACLINQYRLGAKMSLHQDKDEKDFSAPIVSVSLGLPALFLFGGKSRRDKPQRHLLEHGDVVVWGGRSRLFFHGVLPIKDAFVPQHVENTQLHEQRINLTFRKAR